MSATLTVEGLRGGYGRIAVLHGIDLQAAAGKLTVIVGPNGAGKTTLLKAISGLIPREGEVLLDGARLPESPAATVQSGVGHVPEGRQLFAQMTVLETLELGAWLVPRSGRRARLDEVLGLFPRLAERRSQLAGTMSGGEQQMLAIGRTLMSNPRVMMLDEPSLGLAPRMIDDLMRIVLRIRDAGTTVLLVEQNVAKALAIADYAYVVERGRVVLGGEASRVRDSEQVRTAYLGTA